MEDYGFPKHSRKVRTIQNERGGLNYHLKRLEIWRRSGAPFMASNIRDGIWLPFFVEYKPVFLIYLLSCRSTRLPAWTNQNRTWWNITWWLITELCCVPYLFTCNQPEPSSRTLTSWLVYFFVFQIYPDPDSEKAIMGSVVYCIHHKEGCKWTGELRKLKVTSVLILVSVSCYVLKLYCFSNRLHTIHSNNKLIKYFLIAEYFDQISSSSEQLQIKNNVFHTLNSLRWKLGPVPVSCYICHS